MDSVELVKQICRERKIPISKLERDCDFANGYIRKLKEGKFPSDRLQIIAKYLDVPVEYLMTGEGKEEPYYLNDETREIAQAIFDNPQYKALFDASRKLSPEDLRFVMDMIDRMRTD